MVNILDNDREGKKFLDENKTLTFFSVKKSLEG